MHTDISRLHKRKLLSSISSYYLILSFKPTEMYVTLSGTLHKDAQKRITITRAKARPPSAPFPRGGKERRIGNVQLTRFPLTRAGIC